MLGCQRRCGRRKAGFLFYRAGGVAAAVAVAAVEEGGGREMAVSYLVQTAAPAQTPMLFSAAMALG